MIELRKHGFMSTSRAWEKGILIPHMMRYTHGKHDTSLPINFLLLVMCRCSRMDLHMMTSFGLRMRTTNWAGHLRSFIYSQTTCDWVTYRRDICLSVCCANLATSRAFHHHRYRLRVLVHMSLTKGGCNLLTTWW